MKNNLFGHLNRKILNVVIGGILFLVLSAGYDLFIGDRTVFRVVVLVAGIIVIFLAVFLRVINTKKVRRTLEKQMGA